MKSNIYLLLLLTVLGCKTVKNSNNPNVTENIERPPNYVVDQASYKPSETKYFDLIHTKLDVSFNWKKSQLNGEAKLIMTPHAYNQSHIDIDAKGFDIEEVSWSHLDMHHVVDSSMYSYDGMVLSLEFDDLVKVEDTIVLFIKYVAKPNELEEGGSNAISSDKGLYFINPLATENFVPQQIWTQGETEASSCWFPTIDAPNQKTTSQISITVNSKYKTLSNGLLKESTYINDSLRRDTWIQDKKHAPYLVMMAIGEFAVVKDNWKGIDVDYYVEPEYKNMAKKIFGNTPEMLSFYSDLLKVEFPWDKYSQVVIRDYVSGAMENTSAVTFLEFLNCDSIEVNDRNWDFIIAHELFHHWFGDLVTCESWANLSLNESFANYGEYLWIDHKYGEVSAEEHLTNDLKNYLMEAQEKRVPVVRYHYVDKEDMFDRHSYEKGALILHMLRDIIGDDVFFKSLKNYLEAKKYGSAEIHDLRLVFEQTSGKDLNWFFDQWFLSAGHPELSFIGEISQDTLEITLSQNQDLNYSPLYKLPVDILINTSKGEYTKRYWVYNKDTIIKIPLENQVLNHYILDPDYKLLADITELKSEKLWENELFTDRSLRSVNRAIDFCFPNNKVETNIQREMALQLLSSKHGIIRLRASSLLYKYSHTEVIKQQIALLSNERNTKVRRSLVKNLGYLRKDSLQQFFIKELSYPSYLEMSEIVGLISDSLVVDSLFNQHRGYGNYYLSKAFVDYFYENSVSGKLDWMLQVYQKQKLSLKTYFVSSVNKYLSILNEEEAQKAKEFYVERCLNSTIESTKSSSFKALCLMNEYLTTENEIKSITEKEASNKQLDKYLEIQSKYLK